MKKIVSGIELQNKMQYAINLLCDTVKTTLGPKGRNAIIDHSAFTPFITNDGVTIAENIESEDAIINTILELAKEASIKTNISVGDGTTTTLVLLQSIFNRGIEEIKSGENPIKLKKRLKEDLDIILKELETKKIASKEKDIQKIATTSSNSYEIGKNITHAYTQVRQKEAINIIEGTTEQTVVTFQNGYSFDTLLASPYFLNDKTSLELNNCHILIINTYLNEIDEVANYLNEFLQINKDLVIIAEEFDEAFVNNILSFNNNNEISVVLLKTPEYGQNKLDIINDFQLITNAKVIDHLNSAYNFNNTGYLKKIVISKDISTIYFEKNSNIKAKIAELKKKREENNTLEFLNKRIAMLENGIINIYVGGTTKTERRERKMRYTDALCAISTISNGILPGSGITFYQIADEISQSNSNLLIDSLREPLRQILYNSGLNETEILKKIKLANYKIIYNISTDKYENIEETTVIDSFDIVVNTLKNAISIASLMLTTSSLIINEYENNANKINEYNEL